MNPAPALRRAAPDTLGALLGWKRLPFGRGIVIRFQTTMVRRPASSLDIRESDLIVAPQQLRLLARDLARAADELEGKARPPRRSWLRG